MKWTDDIDRGAWLRERIPFDGGYATVAGTGWEAYARILHPVRASGEVDGTFVEHEWTWAEAARRRGVGMHPLVGWNTIGRQDGPVEVDGLFLSPGQEGLLEPRLLRHLVGVLEGATSTPDDIAIGVWDGFGLETGTSSEAALAVWSGQNEAEPRAALTDAELWALTERLAEASVAKLLTGNPPQPSQVPLLELPNREYYLAVTTLHELGDLAEHDDDLEMGVNLIWPGDHQWLVASEIDFDSTVVGGSKGLIERIVNHPDLEAFEVHETDHFDVDARTVS
ncbi:hypothetical protein [Frondihabitans sp. Leaf304]|uniref:hypothetical protein n=1 Tax=Frondihabitans sp. Leaf304 TaxID=1736329 RepID=UPI0006FB5CFD|nr:hypothetical protein [Frondihabitans sp. Leaf304]KQQ28845.1 hypothetical protein ASF54_09520 [Frondihabitans sp. Leaf304]